MHMWYDIKFKTQFFGTAMKNLNEKIWRLLYNVSHSLKHINSCCVISERKYFKLSFLTFIQSKSLPIGRW